MCVLLYGSAYPDYLSLLLLSLVLSVCPVFALGDPLLLSRPHPPHSTQYRPSKAPLLASNVRHRGPEKY